MGTEDIPESPVDDGVQVKEETKRPSLYLLPVLLGAFVCVTSIFVAFRFWPFLWRSRTLGTIPLVLIATSFLIGLILLAVVRGKPFSRGSESDQSGIAVRLASLVAVTLLAIGLLVWASALATPVRPEMEPQKPCIDIYKDAFGIKEDNPNFRMLGKDPDNRRCNVNGILNR